MRRAIVWAIAMATLASGSARADSFPDQDAWRARLITLAPACKVRDEAWAAQFRQAIAVYVHFKYAAYRKFVGSPEPTDAQYEVGNGHIAMAEYLGTRMFSRYGSDACKIFANDDSLKAADDIIANGGPNAKKTIIDPSGHPLGFPTEAFAVAGMEETAAIVTSDECHLRKTNILETAYGAMILPLGDAANKGAASQDQKTSRWNIATGAMDMAYYAGGREAYLMTKKACSFVQKSADLRALDSLVKEERLHPDRWMDRLPKAAE